MDALPCLLETWSGESGSMFMNRLYSAPPVYCQEHLGKPWLHLPCAAEAGFGYCPGWDASSRCCGIVYLGCTMELTADDVRKLALLSRLHVSEENLGSVAGQLQHILEHLEELSALDLSDVPPMMHPDSGERPLRPDTPIASLPRDLALANAPKSVEGFFAIPKVIGAA